jgi:hypothetical protein
VLALGPILHFRLGDTLRGQAELDYINSYASKTKQFNSSRGQAVLRVLKDLGPTDVLSVNVESQRVNFYDSSSTPLSEIDGFPVIDDTTNIPNYTRNELFARYVRTLAHFNVDVSLGWSQIDFTGAPSASTPLARVTLSWQPTTRSNLALTASHQYSDAAQDIMMQPGQIVAGAGAQLDNNAIGPVGLNGPQGQTSPGGINTGDLVIDPEVYLNQSFGASYSYTTDRWTLSAAPVYSRLSYLNDPTFDQTDRGVSAGVSYRVTSLLSVGVFGDGERYTYRALDRRDDTSDYGITLTDRRTPHWTWQVSLTHRQRDSTAAGQSYSENEIYFGVVFKR